MEVKPDRMISLGYGKFWRSDAIIGLRPIDDDRGPGRRTEVFTATLEDPIVASRSERAILQDMAVATDEEFQLQEAREILSELADSLHDVPDVMRRMLHNEADLDVDLWVRRLRALTHNTPIDSPQNDLFS